MRQSALRQLGSLRAQFLLPIQVFCHFLGSAYPRDPQRRSHLKAL